MAQRPAIVFSEEQEQLLEIATNFCRDKAPMSNVRSVIDADQDFDRAVWDEMASLGWLGIAIPEEFGGSGLGLGEVVTLLEPMGRNLFGSPLASTTLVAQALVQGGTADQQREWLPKISEGAIGTLALSESHGDWDLENLTATATESAGMLKLSGTKTFVTDAISADIAIASVALDGKPALVILDREALDAASTEKEITIDETRRSYRLTLDGVEVRAENQLDAARTVTTLGHIHRAACLLLSAEMCGGLAGVLSVLVEYLNTREQFNRMIGSYQALKHPTVDILLALEASRSLLYHAATAFEDGEEGEIAIRMAKAKASESFSFGADRAIQFHGAFGFTHDCDAGLYRRRSLWCEYQHGDAAYHRKKLENLLLG